MWSPVVANVYIPIFIITHASNTWSNMINIYMVKIEGNLKRNKLKILHYLIAFTYGRAEQAIISSLI